MITLKPGHYVTAAGSTVHIFGKTGQAFEIGFEWIEEKNACCDCRPSINEDELIWDCNYHGSGSAKLFPRFVEGAPHIVDEVEKIMADVPDEELKKLPKDGASEHDHYLYGHEKKGEGDE
jgi:hypothetical protein